MSSCRSATLRRALMRRRAVALAASWLESARRPAVCLETRHVRAAMSAQRNKTDATDAIGSVHIMRTGWLRQAHIKTDQAYGLRLLLIQQVCVSSIRRGGFRRSAPRGRGD